MSRSGRVLGARVVRACLLAALAGGAAGCGGRTAQPPEPGTTRGVAPDLRGRTAMILPVQQTVLVPGDIDSELVFGLRDRGQGVEWIPPAELARTLERSPGLRTRIRGLPVGQFLAAEVLRIGDPLFGELFRLSSLVGAQAAVLPVQAALVEEPGDAHPRVRLTVALVETRSGIVGWFGILEGEPHPVGDPRLLASAVDRVARELFWYQTPRAGASSIH